MLASGEVEEKEEKKDEEIYLGLLPPGILKGDCGCERRRRRGNGGNGRVVPHPDIAFLGLQLSPFSPRGFLPTPPEEKGDRTGEKKKNRQNAFFVKKLNYANIASPSW